jgi:KUP system potassium uptake protein
MSTSLTHGADADPSERSHGPFWPLVLGSIGVVYGDIGTSPIYAFKESYKAAVEHGAGGEAAVLGILSLIVWTLLLVVTLKYVLLLLRLDNKGEGGTFALMALGTKVAPRSAAVLSMLGICGAAFFFGDAVITPAISVLSAVEMLPPVMPATTRFVLPITLVIIVCLFAMQSFGTAKVAKYFGPITLVWFFALAAGGLLHIFDDPRIFKALSPHYGIYFIATNGFTGLTVMGFVFLAVTGAEALYADLGHFGARPIQFAWGALVLPALLINYFGQGALLLADPKAIEFPFLKLYPASVQFPMVILSMLATIIASQAVISGTYSLCQQAIGLGLLPRMRIIHTSETVAGQIFMPRVNMLLLVAVLVVTVTFGSSSNLATAYGISVTATMVIASILAFIVIWRHWKWPLWKVTVVMLPLILIEQAFFLANFLKVVEGGWLPLLLAAAVVATMLTWMRGVKVLSKSMKRSEADLEWLIRKLEKKPPLRPPGTAVFLTGDPEAAPTSLMHNLKHNRVLHERNIIMTIRIEDTPRVARHERVEVEHLTDTFIRVIARYGFMEQPSMPKIIEQMKRKDVNIDIGGTSFFLSRRSLKPMDRSPLPWWQERYFIWLASSAADATEYFRIPHDRVVEVGTQVQV